MNEAVDAHTAQPRTGSALGEDDDLTRPLMPDELSDKRMVRAEQVGRQLRHPQLDLAQLLLMVACQGRARGTPGEVRLDRVQTLLDHIQVASHLDEG